VPIDEIGKIPPSDQFHPEVIDSIQFIEELPCVSKGGEILRQQQALQTNRIGETSTADFADCADL
jgi:hypothetical protein